MSTLLIVCAMPMELKGICRTLKNVEKRDSRHYQVRCRSGNILRLVCSGLGSVNAGCAVIEESLEEPLAGVLLLGVGGALLPQQQPGDLVISSALLQHDSVASFPEGNYRVRPGQSLSDAAAASVHDPLIHADQQFLQLCTPMQGGQRQVSAVIASGSEFAANPARKIEIASTGCRPHLLEMEGAGVAQAAQRLGIPWLVAKAVADSLSPDEKSMYQDFKESFAVAIASSARVATHLQQSY